LTRPNGLACLDYELIEVTEIGAAERLRNGIVNLVIKVRKRRDQRISTCRFGWLLPKKIIDHHRPIFEVSGLLDYW